MLFYFYSYVIILLEVLGYTTLFVPFLPAFLSHKGYGQTPPALTGPEVVCAQSGQLVRFFGGGEPQIDRYFWTVVNASGDTLANRSGGEDLQELRFAFPTTGTFTVGLRVRRGPFELPVFTGSQQVRAVQVPIPILRPDFTLCANETLSLQAVDPTTEGLDAFTFEWRDEEGNLISNANTLNVQTQGRYTVRYFLAQNDEASCENQLETFVGNFGEIRFTLPGEEVCEDQVLLIESDSPFAGNWFFLDASGTRQPLPRGVNLTLNPRNQLPGPGSYTFIQEVQNPDNPSCLVSGQFTLEILPAPQLLAEVLQGASCEVASGQLRLSATATPLQVRSTSNPELPTFTLQPGSPQLLSDLTPGVYTFSVENAFCVSAFVLTIPNEAPSPLSWSSEPPVCTEEGVENGGFRLLLNDDIPGTYILTSRASGEEAAAGRLEGSGDTALERLPPGAYQLNFIADSPSGGCAFPEESVLEVDVPNQVQFSAPTTLRSCGPALLAPAAEEALQYSIRFPDGSVQAFREDIRLTQEGQYVLTARPETADDSRCPRSQTIQVFLFEPVPVQPVLIEEDCSGNLFFEAQLDGSLAPETLSFRWYDADGAIIGREQILLITRPGSYSVEALRNGVTACPDGRVPLEVAPILSRAAGELVVRAFCENELEGSISLLLEEGAEGVDEIRWQFFDADGGVQELTAFANQSEIAIREAGTYEAVWFRQILGGQRCEIGRDVALVMPLDQPLTPDLEAMYPFCERNGRRPLIRPGNFDTYRWELDGELLATSATFRPARAGLYTLTVGNAFGCVRQEQFLVFDDCDPFVAFPNALRYDQADSELLFWMRADVLRIEVEVFSSSGALVFSCEATNEGDLAPVCRWSGKINGERLPTGVYPMRVRYFTRNPGLDGRYDRSLVILQ
ncbi:hypothetical protein [Nitritalea halalkaliphila]|nr:hypothetical protein [Nitritalea halalkaliphila]